MDYQRWAGEHFVEWRLTISLPMQDNFELRPDVFHPNWRQHGCKDWIVMGLRRENQETIRRETPRSDEIENQQNVHDRFDHPVPPPDIRIFQRVTLLTII